MVQVYDDNYAAAFALESFYIQEASNQHKILSTLNECVCIESGNISGIEAINESLVDNVKNFFSRIWEFVKKTFGKFKERMAELVTTDKAFLEKYKEIILKKPFKDHELSDCYDYTGGAAEANIAALSKGDFSFDRYYRQIDSQYAEAEQANEFTEAAFIEMVLKPAATLKSNNASADIKKATEISEYVNLAVKGNTTTIKMTSLRSQSLYDFCKNIDATNNQLEKNQATLNTSQDKILSLVNSLSAEAERNASTANNEAVYSNIYGRYITEVEVGAASDQNKNGSSNGGGTAVSGSVTSTDKEGADKLKGDIEQTQKANGNQTAEKANDINEKVKRKIDAYQNFFKYSVSVQSSLMTATIAVYKDYMKLLRVHVRDYVGQEKASDGNNTQQEAPQQQPNQEQQTNKEKKPGVIEKVGQKYNEFKDNRQQKKEQKQQKK